MILIRKPESIYQIEDEIENGAFHGRWHFSFGDYYNPVYSSFGALRVFNDDTLSPGAVWPLHPHRDIEVVTYCAEGEFRHADEHGKGGVLKKGWVQHTTVGRGMRHSEINNRKDIPMRFIQMWFLPSEHDSEPSVEQKAVEKKERTNKFFPLVSNTHKGSLRILSDAGVYSCFLQKDRKADYKISSGRGVYLYVLEAGPLHLNNHLIPALGAAQVREETHIHMTAESDVEILLVDVLLI